MRPIFLTKEEKKKVDEQLAEFGIENIPFMLLKFGRDRIRAYSGSLDRDEMIRFSENVYLELIGLYFAKFDGDEVRVSLDVLHLMKEQISKRIIELNEEQKDKYFEGKDADLTPEQKEEVGKMGEGKGYYILRHKGDILGMAKIINGIIIKNYLPKERRRRN